MKMTSGRRKSQKSPSRNNFGTGQAKINIKNRPCFIMRFKRVDRVNRLIKEELAKIILKEVNFPKDVLVTISRVKTAANLIQAKVFLTVLPEEDAEDILNLLNSRIYGLQQFFNKRVKMRPTPRLIFLSDKNTKEAGRIEKILEELKNREK